MMGPNLTGTGQCHHHKHAMDNQSIMKGFRERVSAFRTAPNLKELVTAAEQLKQYTADHPELKIRNVCAKEYQEKVSAVRNAPNLKEQVIAAEQLKQYAADHPKMKLGCQ
jgi:predicted translin family RNA/ssDNA-binding protein